MAATHPKKVGTVTE